MATFLPPLVHDAAEVTPATGGLYSAATVTQLGSPARIVGGLQLIESNCGAHGLLPVDCPTPADYTINADGPGLGELFPATSVYGADECDFIRSDETARARALHLLALNERQDAERFLADLLKERITDRRTVTGDKEVDRIAAAVAIAEAELGSLGLIGVIHASAGLAVAANRAGVIRWQGNVPLTPLGHQWAFGGGYESLVGEIYVTGPVTVLRSDVVTYRGLETQSNSRLMVAQREIAVGWECLEIGIDFTGVVEQ